MARWTASAKWAAGPALDGQRDMPLALRLSEGLGRIRSPNGKKVDFTLADNFKAVADVEGADRIPLQELKSSF